ncbi:MAG: putative porin [Rhodocyclaceae bacterium]|nr:putative porin [Rhodocyclaceae bacterium]
MWTDSDFGGGGTDTRGHVIRGAYALTNSANMAFSYYINQVGKSRGNEVDYDRFQLDVNFKY